jgi:hypothetical protein
VFRAPTKRDDDLISPLDGGKSMFDAGCAGLALNSMQPEFAVDGSELRRLDQLAVGHAHRMQRTLKLLFPEIEEAVEFGKFGKEIVVLPDIGLEQPMMIGTPIQDVRGGKAVTTHLLTEIL